MKRMFFDAHLDLSMNAMEWNRDLRRPLAEIRQREQGLDDKPDRGRGTVCFPEMRRAHMGLCVGTLIARYVHPDNPLPGWHSPEQAWAQTQGQLAWYRAMEAAGELRLITDLSQLDAHLAAWEAAPAQTPIGYILSLEGADSMVDLSYVGRAWAQGLRAIGPAHYGPGTYAFGTNSEGGIGVQGRALLREMEELGMILDATHLCDTSFWEAMDHFGGAVWASHSNCRSLVPDHRQFSDDQLRLLIGRGAVIGAVMDAWMIVPGWVKRQTRPVDVGISLRHVADHIDHICQLAGNALHVGIGSDLDGGYGTEQGPVDVDSIADLWGLEPILRARGYTDADLEGLFHGNWLRFLRRVWATA
ncbi:MAG: membrane dipeptidase [Bacteroidia bacterium]